MNTHRIFPLTLIALAVLAGCNTMPTNNARLDDARNDYRVAQDDPQSRNLAGGELKLAGDALNKASDAWARGDSPARVDHLAYLAKQRVAIAREVGNQKAAELTVTNATAERDKVRLTARTNEADAAQRDATLAQSQAAAARLQAQASQQQTNDAQARNRQLEAQLMDMNAKKTDRGIVVTISDVLFDTDQARIKPGGMRNVEKLAGFLKDYPQRTARVEGYTDSTGSSDHNQQLSSMRAQSVQTALVDLGVPRDRVTMQGYGEAYPVAGNESAGGRQMNRRVEVILSDDNGVVAPR